MQLCITLTRTLTSNTNNAKLIKETECVLYLLCVLCREPQGPVRVSRLDEGHHGKRDHCLSLTIQAVTIPHLLQYTATFTPISLTSRFGSLMPIALNTHWNPWTQAYQNPIRMYSILLSDHCDNHACFSSYVSHLTASWESGFGELIRMIAQYSLGSFQNTFFWTEKLGLKMFMKTCVLSCDATFQLP